MIDSSQPPPPQKKKKNPVRKVFPYTDDIYCLEYQS